MRITIDEILEKIEDWKRDLFLCEYDSSDPNYHRLEYIKAVLKKYQKIEHIIRYDWGKGYQLSETLNRIREVLEDGSENNHNASNT